MNQRHFFYCVGVVAGVPDASGAGGKKGAERICKAAGAFSENPAEGGASAEYHFQTRPTWRTAFEKEDARSKIIRASF